MSFRAMASCPWRGCQAGGRERLMEGLLDTFLLYSISYSCFLHEPRLKQSCCLFVPVMTFEPTRPMSFVLQRFSEMLDTHKSNKNGQLTGGEM